MLSEWFSWQNVINLAWLIFLLLLLWHFWQDWRALYKARSWLITKGRITQFLWTQEGHQLWPKIEYTYQVYDRDFQGEYFFLDTSHNSPTSRYSRKVAYRAAIAFEKDEDIDVFYNPNDPHQAVLDVHIPTKLSFIIGFLLVLICFHLGTLLYRLL